MFFFKDIFGLPPDDPKNNRLSDEQPNSFPSDDDSNHNDLRGHWGGSRNMFGLPVFGDIFEMHKHFETLFNEMHDMLSNSPSFTFGNMSDEFSIPSIGEGPIEQSKSLRDSCLKSPGYIYDNTGKKEDVNLDGKVTIDDVENSLKINFGTSEDHSSMAMYTPPKVYSKSVYIKTIRKPDGTVETIKKIQDHTGNEETIITHSNATDILPLNNQPLTPNSSLNNQQIISKEDIPGFSILKKFFSF